MITRHHLALGLLCGCIVSSTIAVSDPFTALVVLAGTGTGLLLPDIHMKRPKKTSLLTPAWAVTEAGRRTCVPLIRMLYRQFAGISCGPNEKRLTHSLPGVLLYFLILTGILAVPATLLAAYLPGSLLPGFSGGPLSGMLLHLVQDLCTRKGITPLWPVHDLRIHGSIRPCDIFDDRIFRFHIVHGLVLVLFLVFLYAAEWSAGDILCAAVLAIGLCIAFMVCSSEVEIGMPEPVARDDRELVPA